MSWSTFVVVADSVNRSSTSYGHTHMCSPGPETVRTTVGRHTWHPRREVVRHCTECGALVDQD